MALKAAPNLAKVKRNPYKATFDLFVSDGDGKSESDLYPFFIQSEKFYKIYFEEEYETEIKEKMDTEHVFGEGASRSSKLFKAVCAGIADKSGTRHSVTTATVGSHKVDNDTITSLMAQMRIRINDGF